MLREFAALPATQLAQAGNLTDDVVNRAKVAPRAVVGARRADDGWQDVTASAFKSDIEAAARQLLAAGIQPGARIALISTTRYEWTLLDYAIWWVGAITVPVYATASADQIGWILSDSAAVACIVETADHRARVEHVKSQLPQLRHLWSLDDAVSSLGSAGATVSADQLEQRRAMARPDDVATIIYTSGTTGTPKGCMLTHANFMFELDAAVNDLPELFGADDASTLLILPLPHVFARAIQVGCVRSGVRLGHSANVRDLRHDLGEFQPTFVLAVPRVFENLFNNASQQAHSEGRGAVFDAAVTTAIAYSRRLDRGRIGPALRLRHRFFDRLVYAGLRAALGGRTKYAVSGGAPLGPRMAHFFRGIGVTVLEGYGLTETTAAVTVNRPTATRIGTVGRPMNGTAVQVAEDGELMFKGGQVFRGYWNDEDATHQVLDTDGWLHTGDVGEVDDDGYVTISGRKQEMLVTAGGKSVAPAGLEEAVRAHPLVSQCLVVGEARPFVAALITLEPEALTEWRRRNRKRGKIADLVSDPDLLAEVQRAVDHANAVVSQAEAIRRFRIVPASWKEASGHVTPTLKLRRTQVMRDFADEVEQLYR